MEKTNGYDQSRYQKKSVLFLFYETIQCGKPNLNVGKPKTMSCFVFFEISIKKNNSKIHVFFHFKTKNQTKLRTTKNNNLLSQNHILSKVLFLFLLVLLKLFFVSLVLFAFLDVNQDKYGCRHYWLHERVKQMIGWSKPDQTRGWSGWTKKMNQPLPLNKKALDIIITTHIYLNIHVQKPVPHERVTIYIYKHMYIYT